MSLFRALRVGAWRGIKRVEEALSDDPIVNPATRLRETGGPTILDMGSVGAGQYLKRLGTSVVGASGSGGTLENPPLIAYSKVSEISIQAPLGASTDLELVLSDDAFYTATSPLTVDLTVSGRGGLDTGAEAASTWYYIYAVPSLAAGQFVGVASVTRPGAGGPTGFTTAWRYLGAICNDSGSDLRAFYQAGKDFQYAVTHQAAAIVAFGTNFIDPKQEPAIDDVVPLTASNAFGFTHLVNGNVVPGNSDLYLNIFIEGQSTEFSWNQPDTGDVPYSPSFVNFGALPLPGTTTKKIGFRTWKDPGGNVVIYRQWVKFNGWRDGWLLHWR